MITSLRSRTKLGPVESDEASPQMSSHPFRRPDNLPDWTALLATEPGLWAEAKKKAENGTPVLVASNIGGHGPVSVVESLLSIALTLRGAKVHTLLCDAALPACMRAQYEANVKPDVIIDYRIAAELCAACYSRGMGVFSQLGLSHHNLSDLVTDAQRIEARTIGESVSLRDLPSYTWHGMAVGEHALAGALRYFAKGTLDADTEEEREVARRYLEAAILTGYATQRLVADHDIRHATFHHGIYIPQGVVGEVCRARNVHVSNWVVAYRLNTLIFSHHDTYHHTLMDEPTTAWQQMQWDENRDSEVSSYLRSRWHGARDWIYFHENPDEDFELYIKESKIDPEKPIIGMLTNVFWDAQLHYKRNAFSSMLDWILETIEYFRGRPDIQLLVRIHPAEIRGAIKSRQLIADEITKLIPNLPSNVFVIGPESPVSTYAAMRKCDSVIIYGTKTGVELTSMGIPVIVAGEAWIRNKGLTIDITSKAEYLEMLDRLPLGKRLDKNIVTFAKKYAYHFFFRRMIPLPFLHPMEKGPNFYIELSTLSDLMPGVHKGLDIICAGIMNEDMPFNYPAEIFGIHDA